MQMEKAADTYMIILNWLPPAMVEYPAIALACLKKILEKNNYHVEIIYWNLLLKDWLNDYAEHNHIAFFINPDNNSVLELLLLAIACENFHYSINQAKLLMDLDTGEREIVLSRIIPYMKNRIISHLQDKINESRAKPLVFGVSAKYDQWISAVYFCSLIKKQQPHIKTVIGGFLNKESADILLQNFPALDFAIWGEAEIPLLNLCNRLKSSVSGYSDIPRLLYREEEKIIINKGFSQNTYIPFAEILIPDYRDYYRLRAESKLENPENIIHLMEGSRGCDWSRCSFCVVCKGSRYREKTPEDILSEIDYVLNTYPVKVIHFTDANLMGKDINRFISILDLLIEYRQKNQKDFLISGNFTHIDMNAGIVAKMYNAGFKYILFGYESVSDSILKKLHKKTRFADNILYLRLALKYRVTSAVQNIMTAIPDETEEDIKESIKNLHFLRFLYRNGLQHQQLTFMLTNGSPYYYSLTEEKMAVFNKPRGIASYFLPENMNTKERFLLFVFSRARSKFEEAWQSFFAADLMYQKQKMTYSLQRKGEKYLFKEFIRNYLKRTIELNHLEYNILVITSNKIHDLDSLSAELPESIPGLNREKLLASLKYLYEAYLIYCNSDFTQIVSVIDAVPGGVIKTDQQLQMEVK